MQELWNFDVPSSAVINIELLRKSCDSTLSLKRLASAAPKWRLLRNLKAVLITQPHATFPSSQQQQHKMPQQIKQDLNRSGYETTDFPSVSTCEILSEVTANNVYRCVRTAFLRIPMCKCWVRIMARNASCKPLLSSLDLVEPFWFHPELVD